MKIRAIIVDDEDLARQIVREYALAEGDIEIVGRVRQRFRCRESGE